MNNVNTLLPIGTVLSHDRYRIDKYLASGGFGNTYEAMDLTFNERVAIKELFVRGMCERNANNNTISTIEENASAFTSIMAKFKKEALRLRQIHHTNIVAVRDLFEENGTAYYVMDYLDGESLATRLQKQGRPFTEEELNAFLPDILSALDCVHKQGIWHLDIKPANIMLDKDNHPYLIDFGASKQIRNSDGQTMSTSSSIVLTPGFAPAEQMEQNFDKFGPWTDFYALGATIYVCLTRKNPPLPSDIAENADKALRMSDSLSPQIKNLIMWLMEPNRTKRPQSVSDIQNIQTYRILYKVDSIQETVLHSNNHKQISNEEEVPSNKIVKRFIFTFGAILGLVVFVSFFAYFYKSNHNEFEKNAKITATKKEKFDNQTIVYIPYFSNLKETYYTLKKHGYDGMSYIEFIEKMKSSSFRKEVYGSLTAAGYDMPDYKNFCILMGYATIQQHKDRIPSVLFNFVEVNNICSITDRDVFITKIKGIEFSKVIYDKLKSMDVYGIGNSVTEFRNMLSGNGTIKIGSVDYIKNAEEVYSILVINTNYNSSKQDFIENIGIIENFEFQKSIYERLLSVRNNKYKTFQAFQAAMHPGLLE